MCLSVCLCVCVCVSVCLSVCVFVRLSVSVCGSVSGLRPEHIGQNTVWGPACLKEYCWKTLLLMSTFTDGSSREVCMWDQAFCTSVCNSLLGPLCCRSIFQPRTSFSASLSLENCSTGDFFTDYNTEINIVQDQQVKENNSWPIISWFKKSFTFMHLADAFIQSDLHCIRGLFIFYSVRMY